MSGQLVWASRRIATLERQLAEAQGKKGEPEGMLE